MTLEIRMVSKKILLVGFAFILGWVFVFQKNPCHAAGDGRLRVMTYNIWGKYDDASLNTIANYIKQKQLDVVGIQEAVVPKEGEPPILGKLRGIGYPMYGEFCFRWDQSLGEFGLMVLSKYPIDDYYCYTLAEAFQGAHVRAQSFKVESTSGPVRFFNHHLWAEDPEKDCNDVIDLIEQYSDETTFLMGDFNLGPSYECFGMILETHERSCDPSVTASCGDTVTDPSRNYAVDHIFHDKNIKPPFTSLWEVDEAYADHGMTLSDHFPVIATFYNSLNPEVVSLTPTSGEAHSGDVQTFTTVFRDADGPRGNLVQNGSFEQGTDGWSLTGEGITELVTDAEFGDYAIHAKGDSSRVLQWVTLENTTPYTLSSSAKGTGFVAKADEYCLGGAAGSQWKNGHQFPIGADYTRGIWPFTSATCDADQSHRLAIFFDTGSESEDIWVDGVLLEEGTTQGIFTDINGFQVNLEIEDDQSFTGALWPLRAIFYKERAGYPNRDKFYFIVGGGGDDVEAGVSYSSNKWYLTNDTSVSYGGKTYFTALGGAANTYFELDGNDLIAHWKVRFGPGLSTDTYHTTLLVSDLTELQDISGNLYLNNAWYFHRMGTLTIINPPGDLDDDRDVDADDIKILLSRYLTNDSEADFNDDGVVNGMDFAHVIKSFTF